MGIGEGSGLKVMLAGPETRAEGNVHGFVA